MFCFSVLSYMDMDTCVAAHPYDHGITEYRQPAETTDSSYVDSTNIKIENEFSLIMSH